MMRFLWLALLLALPCHAALASKNELHATERGAPEKLLSEIQRLQGVVAPEDAIYIRPWPQAVNHADDAL